MGQTLETVQESVPSTPAVDPISQNRKLGEKEEQRRPEGPGKEEATAERKARVESSSESGNDKGGNSGAKRKPTVANTSAHITKPNTLAPSAAYAASNSKGKAGAEASVQSMTVETETVSSVPQVAVGGGAGERGGSIRADPAGSVRLRPSMETIKPKKDKKRVMRKTPSLISGTGRLECHLIVVFGLDRLDTQTHLSIAHVRLLPRIESHHVFLSIQVMRCWQLSQSNLHCSQTFLTSG